ncbi:uncharacterized protein LOC134690060 [Mytilus trossulus]|uniref:uncharacterized protein LOC134690060 n=1 Tax=Mytilus trossulus TaxID=6551 RepID=UPI0030044DF0
MGLQVLRLCAVILVIIACLQPIIAYVSNRCFQSNRGLSHGCNLSILRRFPYNNAFVKPCNRHNICYRCGSKFSKTRLYCDHIFLHDMLEVCKRMPYLRIARCKSYAGRVYYKAVRVGGLFFFRKTPKYECSQRWVRSCFA